MAQLLTRPVGATVAELAAPFRARFDFAAHARFGFPAIVGSAARTGIPLTLERAAKRAIHAAGSDERGLPENRM